jgi:hypothetical protein
VFIYLSIFLAIAFASLSLKAKRQVDLALIFFGVFLLLFMGTRFETGCDYEAYKLRFNSLYHDTTYIDDLLREEAGFHLLNRLVHHLSLDFMWLNVLASLIFLIGILRFVRISPSPLILLALLFPVIIIQLGMSGIRQALALSFLLHAVVSFVKGKRISTGIWIVIGAQFHQSAYLFLPMALIAGQTFSWKLTIASVVFIGPAAIFLLGERSDVYTARYINQIYGENDAGGAIFRYALAFVPCLVFEYFRERVRRTLPNLYPLFRIFSIMTFAILPLAFISTVAMHRMTYYIMPVSFMIFVCTVMVIPKEYIISRKWLIFPAGTLALYLVVWFGFSRHAKSCYVPYESFIF